MMTVVNVTGSSRQRGSAMILSVLVMTGLGLIALTSLQQQLSAGLALTSNHHRYAIAWENASSALAWGVSQQWESITGAKWQCQIVAAGITVPGSGQVCVRTSLRADIYLIRGEGKMDDVRDPVMLYQQASMKKQPDGSLRFSPLKQGWLDFCPESDEQACHE